MAEFDRPELICIGTSLGGFRALEQLLGKLKPDFDIPIAVVQHRHKTSNEILSGALERSIHRRVVDAEDKQKIERGRIYLAPANYHLLVEEDTFALSVDDPVAYSRPSVDVLFESAADAYGSRCVAIVLTGANSDGARGAECVKRNGGCVVVQDPATAEAADMPASAIKATKVDRILPLDQISEFLNSIIGGGKASLK